MKQRRKLVRLFCAAMTCIYLSTIGFAEEAAMIVESTTEPVEEQVVLTIAEETEEVPVEKQVEELVVESVDSNEEEQTEVCEECASEEVVEHQDEIHNKEQTEVSTEMPAEEATGAPEVTPVVTDSAKETAEPTATPEVETEKTPSVDANKTMARVLENGTPLFEDIDLTHQIAVANAGDLFVIAEYADGVLCIEYIDEAQSLVRVFIARNQVELTEGQSASTEDGLYESEVVENTHVPEASPTAEPTLVPTSTPIPGSGSGSFVLAAWTDDRLLIVPTQVNYTISDTVRTVLGKLSGHSIIDLESGEISEINGVETSFSRYDSDGGYDLDRYASEIGWLVMVEGDMPSAGRIELIRAMAEYSDSADARADENANAIYAEILEGFLTISDSVAAEQAERLRAVMAGKEESAGDPDAPEQIDGVYQIRTGGEMKWFADLVNGRLDDVDQNASACAVLKNNISLSGIEWTPIGNGRVPFAGSFSGDGHKISGLRISAAGNYQALFGYVGSGASVSDLTVSGSVDAGGSYTAGIIAYSEVSVSNLHNRCKVTSSGQYVGGVVGAFASKNCSASGCSNSGTIYSSNASGATYVGGVLGGKNGNVKNCKNSGTVNGYSYVGGVAGQATNVEDCQNSASVQCVSQYGGGVVGQASSVNDCSNTGTVSASGVYVQVRARYEASFIGGVVGSTNSITDCENSGRIAGRSGARCQFSSVAGVAGKASSASSCTNRGNVTVDGSYIAGVIGGNGGGNVVRCVNYADVYNTAESGEQTGGVASAGKLEQCFNLGSVIGWEAVGGVVGGTSNTTVRYCYNLGSVSGNSTVGGVVGNCMSAYRCYSAASVNASGSKSGLFAGEYSAVTECYYLNSYSLYSKAGQGLNRNDLRQAMRGTEYFVLNFDEDYHGGYPTLSFETADSSAAVEAVRLCDGDRSEYYMLAGGQPAGMPDKVMVTAGGMTLSCKVNWEAPADFDGETAGEYVFTPAPVLPEGCYMTGSAHKETIAIVISVPEDLPLVTSVSLEEGVVSEYTTAFGMEPTAFPTHVLATVNGEVHRMAVEWIAPDNIDLTDTETAFVYNMRFAEACRVEEGIELPVLTLRVQPMMLIESMRFTEKSSEESFAFSLHYEGAEEIEGVQTFSYTLDILDSTESVYISAVPDARFEHGVSMNYAYKMLNASSSARRGELTAGKQTSLSGFAANSRNYAAENTLMLTASAQTDSGEIIQLYKITTAVRPTLKAVAVMMGDTEAYLTPVFEGDWYEYRAQIPASVEMVKINLIPTLDSNKLGGIRVWLNDKILEAGENGVCSATVPVTSERMEMVVSVSAQRDDGETVSSYYMIVLERLQETKLTVNCMPAEARLSIESAVTGPVYADADGRYTLIRSFEYNYTATASGYLPESGSFTADSAEMSIDIELHPAEQNNNIDEDIEASWGEFRGDETNNAVSSSSTPVSASDAVLYWANKAGIDFGSDAVSSPILADGYLICTAKQNIFKIDTLTGEVVQVGDMIKKSAFNITPPTYAKGMIFVALADGMVQAFNAKTLESLWVYTDPLGGQPNSPITYRSGYIYTGFWNGEREDGNWVCLSVTDENPAKATEAKKASWTYTQRGGFYWAGACVRESFMLVGTDDGEVGYTSPTGNLLSLDPDTGRMIDCLSGLDADVRCAICYDAATERFYFTSKGGFFYSVAVSDDGYFRRDTLKKLDLRNGANIEGMSTSTPVVYNGRAYVGVSGVAQFQPYSGHGIAVIDLASWSIAYMCPTRGYPQTSGLLTNAYENTGIVYIYFLDNMTPGSLRVIRDCPGQTQLLSIYDGSPISEAEILFTPRGAQRQYVLCSPIVDEYGTIYFKNDSGHMMALGSKVVSLEVTRQPDKILYQAGETFEATGMRVIAHLANGLVRDVTDAVSWITEPLTDKDSDVTIYFDHVKYNNDAEVIDPPQTVVNLTVLSVEDMERVRAIAEGIDALNEVTLESGETIRALREAYDALSEEQQELITNYEILTRAEEELALLEKSEKREAEKVVRLIDAIEEVTPESAATIRSAFEVYENLSEYGRALVTNYELLIGLQEQYMLLIEQSDPAAAAIMREIAVLGEITADSGSVLYSLRDRYEKLSAASKTLVTNEAVLAAAEQAYAKLIEETGEQVRRVEDMIAAIGTVTLDSEAAIERARTAYDALDETSREHVSNYDKLLDAEEVLALLKQHLGGLGEITAQADALVAQLQGIAADVERINASNAAQLAPIVYQLMQLIGQQSAENQQLLTSYTRIADSYCIAIEACVHEDASTGITASGLKWYQQLKVETLTSAGNSDYSRFQSLIAPKRVIKLYRITVMDLIHGKQDSAHGSMEIRWVIPVPRYNDSSYSTIGVVHVGETAAAQYLESSYANHNRSLKFATRGDGLIGVAGTKAQMIASGSVAGSGSVLGGSTSGSGNIVSSGSVFDELKPNGGGVHQGEVTYYGSYGSYAGGGIESYTTGGVLASYTGAQSEIIAQYGVTVETGEWYYQETVIYPMMLAHLSNAQVSMYTEMSKAVEAGMNRFFAYSVTEQEFEQAYEVYRMSNPLAALAQMSFNMDEGMVDVEYMLSEDAHIAAVENWRVQVERIVNYCMVQGDAELTAARLYQLLTMSMVYASDEWLPAENDEMALFWPGAYYALMNNRASVNDAADVYAYLLMQVGVECMPVREAMVEQLSEEPSDEVQPIPEHIWIVLRPSERYTHADAELDLFREDDPDAARDLLAHFGMSDDRRAESAFVDNGYETIFPQSMLAAMEEIAFTVPECSEALTDYEPESSETNEIVEEVVEEVEE